MRLTAHSEITGTAAKVAAVPTRLALLLGGLAFAFHYSFASLLAAWSHQTPLADLALVPLLGAGLFVAAGPVLLGNYFWPLRLDLLSMPLAAGALVALLFGTRALVAFVFPLFFLFFAWPLPYTVLVENLLSRFTALTAWAVSGIVTVAHLAGVVPGSGNSRLLIEHGGTSFTVSVASACSGVNSAIGFLIVGLACLYVIRGTVARRLTWLLVGLVTVWVFNLLRIVAIVVVGGAFGENAAINVLHPVAGLIALNLAFGLLLLGLPLFGLRLRRLTAPANSDTPIARVAPPEEQARVPGTLWRRLVPIALVVAGLAVANGQLAGFALAYDNAGLPAVRQFAPTQLASSSWRAERVGTFPWSRSSFGSESSWVRYRLRPVAKQVVPRDRFTIWADSIVTPDLSALNAFPVRACYDFHGFKVYADQRVTLRGGVIAELLAYRNKTGGVWHALTWQWPVKARGGHVEHERMVMLASSVSAPLRPAVAGDRWSVNGLVLDVLNRFSVRRDPNSHLTRALIGVASQLVEARLTGSAGAAA
jgi:exosortase